MEQFLRARLRGLPTVGLPGFRGESPSAGGLAGRGRLHALHLLEPELDLAELDRVAVI